MDTSSGEELEVLNKRHQPKSTSLSSRSERTDSESSLQSSERAANRSEETLN